MILQKNVAIEFIPTSYLKHIEDYSKKRAEWLIQKIKNEQIWTKPLCLDKKHHLVMDGQHRMEAAKILGLAYVPCILFDYHSVKIWSLRDNYHVDHETVITRALNENIYPYKTVKHLFPIEIPTLKISLHELLITSSAKESVLCE